MQPGLEGVVAAETVLSHADPATGMQWLRGHPLPELVAQYGHEGAAGLLWEGFAGHSLTRDAIQALFGQARQAAFAALPGWLPQTRGRPLEEAVRIGLASPARLRAAGRASPPRWRSASLPCCARPRASRRSRPTRPSRPPPTCCACCTTACPTPEAAQALDTYFTVMADSGMSTSSFTARAIASTRASLSAAVTGRLVRVQRRAARRCAGADAGPAERRRRGRRTWTPGWRRSCAPASG